MDFIPIVWTFLGVLFIAIEFFTPGFVIFFFGIGALLSAALTTILPFLRSNVFFQVIFWLASSLLSLAGLRKYFAKAFKGKLITGLDDTSVAGMKAVVVEEITPDKPGRIRFQGTTWTALSFDEVLPAGKTVEILQKDGLKFTVTSSLLQEGDSLIP